MSKTLQIKYGKNAYAKSFDWDWRAINYNRIAIVNLLVQRLGDCDYLEIGCASNQLFNSVPATCKVGVDPASGGNIRATSDHFFSTNNAKFDLVFIDGLHTYEQVRQDVINAIRCLKPGGYIALHDMLPRSWIEEHTPVITHGAWTGDVWKVAFELVATHGLEFKIVKVDYGVGVIKILQEPQELVDMRGELKSKGFSYYYENIAKLPLIDWCEFKQWAVSSKNAA